jgi:hypothetical protein
MCRERAQNICRPSPAVAAVDERVAVTIVPVPDVSAVDAPLLAQHARANATNKARTVEWAMVRRIPASREDSSRVSAETFGRSPATAGLVSVAPDPHRQPLDVATSAEMD